MKKILLLSLLFCLSEWVAAQQLPLFTQYREQIGIINPAAIQGDYFIYEHNVSMGGSYRRQWVGLDNAPTTQTIHGQYMYAERGGFGWIAEYEKQL